VAFGRQRIVSRSLLGEHFLVRLVPDVHRKANISAIRQELVVCQHFTESHDEGSTLFRVTKRAESTDWQEAPSLHEVEAKVTKPGCRLCEFRSVSVKKAQQGIFFKLALLE
jgi:hypothetical protein